MEWVKSNVTLADCQTPVLFANELRANGTIIHNLSPFVFLYYRTLKCQTVFRFALLKPHLRWRFEG